MNTRSWLTITDVADEYGLNERTVRRHISSGRLPAYRVGWQVRIRQADAEALAVRIPAATL